MKDEEEQQRRFEKGEVVCAPKDILMISITTGGVDCNIGKF
jgi:hypothetical protein